MNETTALWNDHSAWATIFSESDRLLVDSLVRRGSEVDERVLPLGDEDGALVCALLFLVRSMRLDHVALSLDEATLSRHVAEASSALDGAGFRVGDLLAAVTDQRRPLARALMEHTTLSDEVAVDGPTIVITHEGSRPTYAHVRRLAYAEWRLSEALLGACATTTQGVLGTVDVARVLEDLRHEPAAAAVTTTLVHHRISIVTGGPGTGKTTAMARALQALGDDRRRRAGVSTDVTTPLSLALCAPTAKAAVRLREALDAAFRARGSALGDYADVLSVDERSGSVHRLLGLRPDRAVSHEPLGHDLVIVDEVSMLELPLLDQLVARLPATSRVVLVGDPDQLASVNVGAALRDVVDAADTAGPLAPLVTRLSVNYRSNVAIRALADAINAGDLDRVVAATSSPEGPARRRDDRSAELAHARAHALAMADAADTGDTTRALALLDDLVVLCATRQGDGSVAWWRAALESDLRRRRSSLATLTPGTPMLVTRNEPADAHGARPLSNGDVGVVTQLDTERAIVFPPASHPRVRALHEVPDAESAWAITIHKSQGSEYNDVIVSLPSFDSAILTRELLYTAVTRARERVTLIADTTVLRRTLARRIARVSALTERLRVRATAASERPAN